MPYPNAYIHMRFKNLGDSLLYLPFDDDADDDSGNGRTPSTESGAIIYPDHITPQVGSGAVQLAEATTNLAKNPRGAINTAEWTFFAGITGSAVTDITAPLGTAIRMEVTGDVGTNTGNLNVTGTLGIGDPYTLTLTVKGEATAIGKSLYPFLYASGGAAGGRHVADTPSITLTGEYQTVTASGVLNEADRTTIGLYMYYHNDEIGDVIYVTSVQVENKAYPIPYCDGSLGEGHSWSGTAHASTSSRTKTQLAHTLDLPAQWTIGFWYIPLMLESEATGSNCLFHWYGDTDDYLMFYIDFAGDRMLFQWLAQGTSNLLYFAANQWARLTPIHYTITYDGTDLRVYQDGVILSGETEAPTQPTFGTTPSVFHFNKNDGNLQPNGWQDELIVLDYALTADEVEILYEDGIDGLPFGGAWTDVSADVRSADKLRIKYGIWGNMPTDRVARTGTFKFTLDNSVQNSGGLNGYYTYGHTNCRSGFKLGVDVRAKFTYLSVNYIKHLGRLVIADPTPGVKAKRSVDCVAHDWMAEALRTKCKRLPISENVKTEDALAMLIALAGEQPNATSYATGQENFAIFPDMAVDEKTSILRVMQDLMMSEFGFSFVTGDGTFTFQDRHARVKDTAVQITIDESLLFNVKPKHRQDDLLDKVKAIVYPRDISSSDETLYSLTTAFQIMAGESKTMVARYSDPNNRDSRLSALTLQDPEGLNNIANRGFEDDAANWAASAGASLARDNAQKRIGSYSGKLTSGTGGANAYNVESDKWSGPVQNDVIYYQTYIYASDVWPAGIKIWIVEYDSGDVEGTATELADLGTSTSSAWVRSAGPHTCVDADCAKVAIRIGHVSDDFSGGAVSLYVDEVYLIDDVELNFDFDTSSGGGGDLNQYLEFIDTIQGGNSTEFVLKNVGSEVGWVADLYVEGKAIRVYDPVTVEAYDAGVGSDREVELRLKYQGDHLVGQDFANITLSGYSVEDVRPFTLGFHANKASNALIHALELEPGKRIALTESMIGKSAAEYFIQGVELIVSPAPSGEAIIDCYWSLSPAGTEAYWLLGTSQLGIDNYLGF